LTFHTVEAEVFLGRLSDLKGGSAVKGKALGDILRKVVCQQPQTASATEAVFSWVLSKNSGQTIGEAAYNTGKGEDFL
jgi:hypothetical protein